MRLTLLLATLLLTFAHAASSTGTALVPGGYHINPNSYGIPADGSLARVGGEIHIFAPNGTVVHKATAGKALPPSRVKRAVTPLPTGNDAWDVYAWGLNSECQPVGSVTSTWEVPSVPARDDGQTLFLFLGMEPTDGADEILEAVLQYGPSEAGGGAFRSLASWLQRPPFGLQRAVHKRPGHFVEHQRHYTSHLVGTGGAGVVQHAAYA
ncbi:hypothetical protein B0H16DRAFT_1452689 [Mycena metata]|uniref:Uncharacterized protein n=1 Tax=Mycena metata TaxID=1033252 RepID=A0AAD7NPH7_9AGAR|nr:hypothetical protein B0H16DRAFT_1452689 [Mycena metata]